jgi:hypothetical protein
VDGFTTLSNLTGSINYLLVASCTRVTVELIDFFVNRKSGRGKIEKRLGRIPGGC